MSVVIPQHNGLAENKLEYSRKCHLSNYMTSFQKSIKNINSNFFIFEVFTKALIYCILQITLLSFYFIMCYVGSHIKKLQRRNNTKIFLFFAALIFRSKATLQLEMRFYFLDTFTRFVVSRLLFKIDGWFYVLIYTIAWASSIIFTWYNSL